MIFCDFVEKLGAEISRQTATVLGTFGESSRNMAGESPLSAF